MHVCMQPPDTAQRMAASSAADGVFPDLASVITRASGVNIDPDQEFAGLHTCLKELASGPWTFIQLRGAPIDSDASARGCIHSCQNLPEKIEDIDLLGSRESVRQLLQAAFAWVRAGRCHMRLRCRRRGKSELTLFSTHGLMLVKLDLWTELAQLDHGRFQLTFTDCVNTISEKSSGVVRLPPDLEVSVYLQHLISKGRNLSRQEVQDRLQQYILQCQQTGLVETAEELIRIRSSCTISDQLQRRSMQLIHQRCQPQKTASPAVRLLRRLNDGRLNGPRRVSMVSFMGCDGAGKTTLANQLRSQQPAAICLQTGKHLYRKSLLYKLAVILLRPCLLTSRERFDELLSPLLYLRASAALRLRLLLSSKKRLTIIDRSLADFLIVHRKTDHPRFHRSRRLTQLTGCRIPAIHFLVAEDRLRERKQEVTAIGQRRYDQQVLEHFIEQTPTDYFAFGNDLPQDQAAEVLLRILAVSSTAELRVQPA